MSLQVHMYATCTCILLGMHMYVKWTNHYFSHWFYSTCVHNYYLLYRNGH